MRDVGRLSGRISRHLAERRRVGRLERALPTLEQLERHLDCRLTWLRLFSSTRLLTVEKSAEKRLRCASFFFFLSELIFETWQRWVCDIEEETEK